jgi:SNF2 family DNA or RNA helicase
VKFTPHNYQLKGVKHALQNEYCAEFLDMGLGKTVITLTAIATLLDRCKVRGVLIVAPKRVCDITWPTEIRKWDHTRRLTHIQILGSPTAKEIKRGNKVVTTRPSATALSALSSVRDIYLANYEILPSLAVWMAAQKTIPWDMIVWDESSKMKSASSRRFKLMKPVLGRFSRGMLLSGTPAPQSYEDLWSQFYLLDGGERLGQFVSHFRDRYFQTVDRYGYIKKLRPGSATTIERKIQDITLCLKAEDYLSMPKLVHTVVDVPLSSKLRDQYEKFEEEMFIQLESGDGVEALNAASLSSKCRQFTSGAIYKAREIDEQGKPIGPKEWSEVHEAKMDALEEVIDGACGNPVLVAYEFQHELARLQKRWPKATWLGGSADAAKIVRDWDAGKIQVLIAHPASIGHGLNLQYGGNRLVFTSGTWSLELYEQTICRFYRQGQTKPVLVYHLRVPRTADVAVGTAIGRKAKSQAALLAALKAYRVGKK